MITGIVILAGGSGSRLNLGQPKPLVPFMGIPMIQHLIQKIPKGIPYSIIISKDHLSQFEKALGPQNYWFQPDPLGTGHAISSQYEKLKDFDEIIILNGDTPLVPTSLMEKLLQSPKDTLVGFELQDTQSYGQIIQHNGKAIGIVESKDREKHLSSLCYSGLMKITQSTLKALRDIPPSPITGEYYLTHIVSESHPFNILIEPPDALQGINTFEELKALEKLYQSQIYQDLLRQEVSVMHHETLNLINTEIGKGTHIDQQVTLRNSQIGENCKLGQGVILDRVKLSDDVTILPYSVLSDCSIGSGSTIGPFAHIQEQTIIGQKTYIGNFVEIKRSLIADGVKAKHLSYLGDAYVDTRANIGAGTITCNYVPWRKEKSISYVGSHALVGANCLLIAPCHIGPYTICAAGSVLQGNILPSQLAISRAPLSIRFSAKLRKEVEY